MIQYLEHKYIDKRKWDDCIHNSPNGLIYAYSWYLDIVCPGWDALVEGDYLSILPLPKAEKYSFTYTYPPLFTQQLGLFSIQDITEDKIIEFISKIPPHFRYIEMNLNEKNIITSGLIETRELTTYILNLNSPYIKISAHYSTQTKRNLKKALSSSLTIVQSALPSKIIKLFRENKGMSYELPTGYYTILEHLIKTLVSKGLVKSIGVNDKYNQLCAGAFFVKSTDRDIFLFSGANENAYSYHAMTLLINSYIEEHAGRSNLFDFEGSMNLDLARFYRGFGSTETHYTLIRKNTLPLPLKFLKEIQYKRNSLSF